MYDIPTQIVINDKKYAIRDRGDFRMVLECFSALNDEALSQKERLIACLIIFYDEFDNVEDLCNVMDIEPFIKEMFSFFSCGRDDKNTVIRSYRLVDWKNDEQLICSAVNKVAGMEVRAEKYIHWWTFMGYYMSVGECTLSTVLNIRSKIMQHEKLEKYEKKYRQENPQYFSWDFRTVADKENAALMTELWNNGK